MQGKLKLYLVMAVMVLPIAIGLTMLVPSRAEAWNCLDLNDHTLFEWSEGGPNPCLIEDKVFNLKDFTINLQSGRLTFDPTMSNPGFTLTFDTPLTVIGGDSLFASLEVTAKLNDAETGVPIHDVSYKVEGTNFGTADLLVFVGISSTTFLGKNFPCLDGVCNGEGELLFDPTDAIDLMAAIKLASFSGVQSITAISFHFSEGTEEVSVPEPAPFGLLGSGLIGLMLFRRRLASVRV